MVMTKAFCVTDANCLQLGRLATPKLNYVSRCEDIGIFASHICDPYRMRRIATHLASEPWGAEWNLPCDCPLQAARCFQPKKGLEPTGRWRCFRHCSNVSFAPAPPVETTDGATWLLNLRKVHPFVVLQQKC